MPSPIIYDSTDGSQKARRILASDAAFGSGSVKAEDLPLGSGVVITAAVASGAITQGKIGTGAVTTAKINDGALSADAAGRAKIANGFFDAATVNDKFADAAISLAKLAEAVLQADGGQALTGNLPAGNNRITGLATPVDSGDAATRGYVDDVAQGLLVKNSCRLATAADLPANTPSGSGVGKTLTANANGALSVDGVAVALNNRILVKNYGGGATSVHNGIYKVTQVGDESNPWILTRATDYDGSPGGEVRGGCFTFVEEGSQADTGWVMNTPNGVATVDTSVLGFVQFSSAGSYTAGVGLVLVGSEFSVDLAADPGLEFDAGDLRVKIAANAGLQRTANGVGIDLDGDSMALGAGGVKAAVPTASDKARPPLNNCTANDSPTGLTITSTPGGNGMVNILVNGVKYELGNGSKLKDCYFSDGAGGARAISAITAGDELYWNAGIAGFDLVNDGTDKVDMDYAVA